VATLVLPRLPGAGAGILVQTDSAPSLSNCVDALHLSEGAAYKRIAAARTARRFPVILEMLAGGRLHLSAVCLLAPHLTEENQPSLLEAAVHRSKRRVELLMAERFPKPDVPQSIRKLPAPQPEMAVPSPIAIAARPAEPSIPKAHVSAVPAAAPAPPPRPAVVAPLAPERFKLQLTISRKTRERLEEARDLLDHQVPDGDLAEVMDRALDVLVRELRRKKYAETEAPRKPRLVEEKGNTRHILGTRPRRTTVPRWWRGASPRRSQVARVIEVEAGEAGVGMVHLDRTAQAIVLPGRHVAGRIDDRGHPAEGVPLEAGHQCAGAEPSLHLHHTQCGEPLRARCAGVGRAGIEVLGIPVLDGEGRIVVLGTGAVGQHRTAAAPQTVVAKLS
jgi:hypothetical protein